MEGRRTSIAALITLKSCRPHPQPFRSVQSWIHFGAVLTPPSPPPQRLPSSHPQKHWARWCCWANCGSANGHDGDMMPNDPLWRLGRLRATQNFRLELNARDLIVAP
eukprot:scaffold48_cov311-Pinguiococcus_pyrenoidosus.AAC.1